MKYSKFLFGVVYPILSLVVVTLFLTNLSSAAGAAEFAALGIFIYLLFFLPGVIIVNFLLLKAEAANLDHYKRGMIFPCLFIVWVIIYQLGWWDRIT